MIAWARYWWRSWRSVFITGRCRRSEKCNYSIVLYTEAGVIYCNTHQTVRLITCVLEMSRLREQLHVQRQRRAQ